MIDLSTIDDALSAIAIARGTSESHRWDRTTRVLNLERAQLLSEQREAGRAVPARGTDTDSAGEAAMNLSDALMARIGQLVRRYGDPALQLEWVRAIEADLREEQEREIDSDRMPFILTKQAG